MKNSFLAFTLAVLLVACGGDSKNKRIVPNSSGNINNVSVVVDNLLWEDTVGEAIRSVLAAPLEGLPQDEPIFDLSQMPTQVFSGFTTKNRTILKIEKGKPADTKILTDVYAKPQVLALITGETNAEIEEQLMANAEKIIDAFKKAEIKEQQRRIALSLFDDEPLQENLGINLKFSSVYRIAKKEDHFFWIRKDTKTGTMDLLVYQVPLDAIRKGDSAVVDVVKLRDSIGKNHIPGRIEGAHMTTENAYSPYIFQTIIDNKPTLETKGIWDVKNDFMSGPFINYAIEDQVNDRYVVIEGYVFAPSVQKRDYIFELESIIRSVKIK
ncbi:uncharacterized protein DUF4837 [Flavobacteriaceae bacterium MAR_2010_72]|nr:uncharacterized protein DUF4837 [Flavobacteriaceae bacterium MAR_2010_72]TVZ58288.1 uncharacterized protein DUF4837 [Flavobacteriaceae bacterium MAR_2010_105]